MAGFEFEWKCPKCGNVNVDNAVKAQDYTVECSKCGAECEVFCEVEVSVSYVNVING